MWGMGWERVTTLAIYVIFAYLLVTAKEKSNADPRPSTSS
jgi:hypothetical protein